MIDLTVLRRQVEAFPPPERLREEMRGGPNPTPGTVMIAAWRTLAAAEYLNQQSNQASTAQGCVYDAAIKVL